MEEPISVADLKAGLRRATIANELVPSLEVLLSKIRASSISSMLLLITFQVRSKFRQPTGMDPKDEEKSVG